MATGNPFIDDADTVNPPPGGSPGDQGAAHSANPFTSDQGIGGNSSDGLPPSFLDRAWSFITGGGQATGRGVVTREATGNEVGTFGSLLWGPKGDPNKADADFRAGVGRGVRDVTDKLENYPNPEYGYTPTPIELDQARLQNASDRAQFNQDYGGSPSASVGRGVGQTMITAPVVTGGLGLAGAGLRAALPGLPWVADVVTGSAGTGIRGLPGMATRLASRAVAGGEAGAGQGAMTSDPSKPLVPQVAVPALEGAGMGAALSLPFDAGASLVRRLSGQYVGGPRINGQLPDATTVRANQAQYLEGEGVPAFAAQVSQDPVLQARARYGNDLPFSGASTDTVGQTQAFRQRALRDVGDPTQPNASIADSGYVTRNFDRIGRNYDASIGSVNNIPSVDANGTPITTATANIRAQIPPSLSNEAQAQIRGALDAVDRSFTGGTATGSDFQNLTRRTTGVIAPLLDSDNPALRQFGQQIRAALNNRVQMVMSPADQAAFNQANSQFRALSTIRDAAQSDGTFTPGQLYAETRKAADQFGPGSLDRLAEAGNTVIQPTLEGKSWVRPAVAGTAGATVALAPMYAAVQKLLAMDLATGGGLSSGTGLGLLGLNRLAQSANAAGGRDAIASVLAGGGAPSYDIGRGLTSLLQPALSGRERGRDGD